MACSGCAVVARLLELEFSENKKGPKRPHAHRPNLGWPQPSPAVRLGTTRISSLVILLRICLLELPKGCAVISASPQMSREVGTTRMICKLSGVFYLRRGRFFWFQPCARCPAVI